MWVTLLIVIHCLLLIGHPVNRNPGFHYGAVGFVDSDPLCIADKVTFIMDRVGLLVLNMNSISKGG